MHSFPNLSVYSLLFFLNDWIGVLLPIPTAKLERVDGSQTTILRGYLPFLLTKTFPHGVVIIAFCNLAGNDVGVVSMSC